jgi:hypothetical protein
MALTEVLRSDTFEQWRTKTNTVSSDLGDRATLSANITANTSLVGAINELQSDIGVIGSLSTFAASNVVAALNELKTGSLEQRHFRQILPFLLGRHIRSMEHRF